MYPFHFHSASWEWIEPFRVTAGELGPGLDEEGTSLRRPLAPAVFLEMTHGLRRARSGRRRPWKGDEALFTKRSPPTA